MPTALELQVVGPYALGDRRRFPNGDAKCIGVICYHDRTVFVFEMLYVTGIYKYRSVVERSAFCMEWG